VSNGPTPSLKCGKTDISRRIEQLRESKAEFVNIGPSPGPGGRLLPGHSRVDLRARGRTDETGTNINIEIGGKGTFEAFTQALSGAQPGESREADISLPGGLGPLSGWPARRSGS